MASHNPRLPKPIYNRKILIQNHPHKLCLLIKKNSIAAYAGVGQVDDDFVKEFSKKLHV